MQAELGKQRAAARETEDKLRSKTTELVALKDREKAARAEAVELKDQLAASGLKLAETTKEYVSFMTMGIGRSAWKTARPPRNRRSGKLPSCGTSCRTSCGS